MLPCRKLSYVRAVSLHGVSLSIMPKIEKNDKGDKGEDDEGNSKESSTPKSRKKRSVYDAPAYTDANGNPTEEFK